MHTVRFFLVMLLIITAVLPAFAAATGSVGGRITDHSTGNGLSHVNIILVNTGRGSASDTNGYYQIDHLPPGKYILKFRSMGYKTHRDTVTIEPGRATGLDARLEPDIIQTDNIVITAARQSRLLEQTPDVTMVQTAGDIRAMGAAQINDVIEYMPGINSIAGTGSGQPFKRTISMNGMPPCYSLILVDGMRIPSSHIHTGANVNIVPLDHIERIELVKGAMSAQYGTDAMGGILNIITYRGSDQDKFSFRSYGGSRETWYNGLSMSGSLGDGLNHSLCTSWEQSEGTPIIEPVFRKGRLSYTKFQLMDRIDAQITDQLRAGVSVHYMNAETPYRQQPQASTLFTPSFELQYRSYNNVQISASGYYSRWKSQLNNELNEIASPQLLVRYSGLERHKLLMGTEMIDRNFARKRVAEHNQRTYGIFAQDEISLKEKWTILAALRLDKVENINAVLSPKVSLLWDATTRLAWRVSGGRGFRAPTVQDLYETLYTHPGDIHYRAGNPDLQPEYSTSFITGLDFKPADNLSLVMNGYYYAIENMITPIDHGLEDPIRYFPQEQIPFVTDSLVYIYRRENIHSGRIGGGEIKILWHFITGFRLEGGFNFSHNQNTDTGESLPYYPGKSLALKLSARQPLSPKLSWGGFIGMNAVSDRKIWKFKHSGEQSVKLDDYQKLDAGFRVYYGSHVELFFNADNILGQELHLYEDVDFVIEGTPLYRFGVRLTQ